MKIGLDLVEEGKVEVKGKSVGLIINHTSFSSNLSYILEVFEEREAKVRAIFSPEHGIFGSQKDGEKVEHQKLEDKNIPVYSLYDKYLKPTSEMLDGLDLLVYDIQDVGARFYTYISTMLYSFQSASENGVKFLVLDRPNPIGGTLVEGPVLKDELRSFVGAYSLPIRYALTPGELANLYAKENGINNFEVIKLEGWKRSMLFDETGLPWIFPSPNMPSLTSALLYPGICLFEGTNLSVGRGTSKPFEVIGAPWINEQKLAKKLKERLKEDVGVVPVRFIPYSSKYKDELCRGIYFVIKDRKKLKSVSVAIKTIYEIFQAYKENFKWDEYISRGEEKVDHFSLLAGDRKVRKLIESNENPEEIISSWNEEQKAYLKRIEKIKLYE
ncbi:MAG: exo-beta-N-acetylmuramidase NamZ family protein [Thermoproteota archaeon]